MLGVITKKQLAEEAVRIYKKNDSSKSVSNGDFYYRCGKVNAINELCSRFGIDIEEYIKEPLRGEE